MHLTESQLRTLIRRIILESIDEEEDESSEEPMGDESKIKAAVSIAKEVSGAL